MANIMLLDHATKTVKDKEIFGKSSAGLNTRVIFKNHYTGKTLLETRNKLILPGSGLIAHKIFDVSGSSVEEDITPTYDTKIASLITNLTDQSTDGTYYTNATADNHKVLLFCVGTDGCGAEASQVYSVNYKKWCDPSNLVPFKYGDISDDITTSSSDKYVNRDVYFGKAVGNGKYYFYFKRFDNFSTNYGVTFKQVFENGTNITSDVYENTSPEEIYTYIELNMSITDRDCIDYINDVSQNNKINTLQLCTAYPVSGRDEASDMPDDAKLTYFKDIRPITKLNFSNEILTGNKAIDITYQIYF
jgi:hypothetical protein